MLVDGSSAGAVTTYTFTNVTGNHTISATFAIDTRTITASTGADGTISPSGAVVVNYGANQTFTITPNANYHVLDVLVDGASAGAVTTYTFTNVTVNHTIAASFAIDTRTITASAGASRSISPTGTVTVSYGANQTFTMTPSTGYHLADVLVDGSSVGAVTPYAFTNVTANHTIAASFAINMYTLTVVVTGNGSISKSPNMALYPHGTCVTLTASPAFGFTFMGWSGAGTGTTNPIIVCMTRQQDDHRDVRRHHGAGGHDRATRGRRDLHDRQRGHDPLDGRRRQRGSIARHRVLDQQRVDVEDDRVGHRQRGEVSVDGHRPRLRLGTRTHHGA